MNQNSRPGDSSNREITITRLIDAPRDLVFEAWTHPEHISKWWGPRGFRTTTYEMEVAPGGAWRFTMHGPDGTDYPNRIVYQDVVKPERLVFLHGDDGDWTSQPPFHVTATFTEENGKTRVTMRSVFNSPEERDAVIKFGAVEGGNQTLERLGEHVANQGATTKPFVISREFDVPRDLMFKVWTDAGHLTNWWGPKGATIVSCRNDLRAGGMMHYCMRTPAGQEMWGRWVYRDIIPPERLVFVNSFSDEQGGVTRHPMAPEWPQELLSTISFRETDGRTTVTVSWVPLNPTAVEKETFDKGHGSMQGGWSGTLENLAEYLGKIPAAV